jgi:Holliday junction resolvase RusA-like endonuclease
VISFTVIGIPQPRGSKRAMPNRAGGRPLMVDTNAKSAPWMATVAAAASEAMKGQPLLDGPLVLTVRFNFPRPKSHYRTGKHSAELRTDAPSRHSKKPDCDKLLRAICDAMTGVVYHDDAQISTVMAWKHYQCKGGSVLIEVEKPV